MLAYGSFADGYCTKIGKPPIGGSESGTSAGRLILDAE
jgi:hypothetical protein